MLSDLSDTTM